MNTASQCSRYSNHASAAADNCVACQIITYLSPLSRPAAAREALALMEPRDGDESHSSHKRPTPIVKQGAAHFAPPPQPPLRATPRMRPGASNDLEPLLVSSTPPYSWADSIYHRRVMEPCPAGTQGVTSQLDGHVMMATL